MALNKEDKITKAESQAILEKYDRESAFRTFTDYRSVIISAILILFSLFQLYSTWFVIPSTHMRPIHLAVVVPMAFILYPVSKKMKKKNKLP